MVRECKYPWLNVNKSIQHPTYRAWCAIKRRCYNTRDEQYKNYGARGIKMYKDWVSSFETFYKEIGEKPGPEYSIDRINNDGNYEPGNCRWAIKKEQCANRRNTVKIEYNGKKEVLSELCEKLGLDKDLVRDRIKKSGWSIHKAMSEPVMKKEETILYAKKKRAEKFKNGELLYTNAARGENSHWSKVKEWQVIELRERFKQGVSAQKLSEEYDIPKTTIYNIVRRVSWKHIP